MSGRNKPILGSFNEATIGDPLKIVQKLSREQILKQSEGAGLFEQAVVVEIDEVGGLFGDPDILFGSPRFSIRARVLDQSGDGANADLLRSTDELKVCFPFNPSYHVHQPIKMGEKVWVFELPGINNVTQRYWMHRTPSPTVLSLAPFARPNNNYADASYEANLFRENPNVDVNTDKNNSDTIDRLALRNEEFSDEANPETAGSHFSKVANDKATLYGFVNEIIPEWFYRPSDMVVQGSNNSGVLFGTNMVTIEDESEAPDISDIISIYGGSNDASDFANARDQEVMRADRAPISAQAAENTATAHMVAGRRFELQSFTLDSSRLSLFQNIDIDSAAPFLQEIRENLVAEPSGFAPAALLRSDNVRVAARNSVNISAASGAGFVIDQVEEGRILGTAPRLLKFNIGENVFQIDGTEQSALLDLGVSRMELTQNAARMESNASFIKADAAGVEISGPLLKLIFSQISLPSVVTTQGGAPVTFSSGLAASQRSTPVANQQTIQALANVFQVQAAALAAPPLTPVGSAFQAIAAAIRALPLSQDLRG